MIAGWAALTHCWGCALGEEVRKGREFPLLISVVALHCTAPRGTHGHWAWMSRVEELEEEVQEWGDGH